MLFLSERDYKLSMPTLVGANSPVFLWDSRIACADGPAYADEQCREARRIILHDCPCLRRHGKAIRAKAPIVRINRIEDSLLYG
jgi:hypothetical protein